jgi:hypothetical protein
VARSFVDLPTARARTVEIALESRGVLQWGFAVELYEPERLRATRVYVDGHGRPLGRVPLERGGLARVWGRSPDHGGVREVRLQGIESAERLFSEALEVSGCAGDTGPVCRIEQFAAPDGDGNWRYDPDPSDPFDPFSEVNAWHHLEDALGRLAEVGLDDLPRRVHAIVNFRLDETGDGLLDPFPNALYMPRMSESTDGLVFGHVGTGSLAHDADVLRHELVHAATVHLADLYARFDDYGLDHQPSVIAEAVADYFAAALSGDPAIGVHTGRLLGLGDSGIRRLDLDLSCPADLVGQPHADAEVFGGALWRARTLAGERMDVVVASALRAMPHQPSLAQAAQAVAATATVVLAPDVAAEVVAVLEETGLLGCSRFRRLEVDAPRFGWLPVTRQMGRLSPGPFQYRIPIPEGAGRVRIRIEHVASDVRGPDSPGEAVLHVRIGAPVKYLRKEMGGLLQYEIVDDLRHGTEVILEDDAWSFLSEPVLFASPANRADHPWGYRLSVEVEARPAVRDIVSVDPVAERPPAEVTASSGDVEPGPTGCGPGGAVAILLLVCVGALMRGRRRRPGQDAVRRETPQRSRL